MNSDKRKGWDWLGLIVLALVMYACANRGYPEGGKKDSTAPVVIAESPVSYSTNFDKKKVEIYFDEFVQLKEINEKFIFSPPLEKNPKVSLRGRYIQVRFDDSLRKNATYTMDFADAIVDNNEGNPLGFYRYVFSTGDVIDTLELGGQVLNAESYEPMMNVMVLFYENQADSMPLLELPNYMARTDSSGMFRVTNIKSANYRIFAVEDKNKDKKYTPEVEMFAYLDSTIFPIAMPLVKVDTFHLIDKIVGVDTSYRDSVSSTDYIGYGPSNLSLRIFEEKLTMLYMMEDERKERETLNFIFSVPADNQLKVSLWDTLATAPLPEDWYTLEKSVGNDTITLWIKDSTIYKKDTLNVILSYLRTDTLGQRTLVSDTNRYTFKEKELEKKEKKKGKGATRKDQEIVEEVIEEVKLDSVNGEGLDEERKKEKHKKEKEELPLVPEIDFLGIKLNVSGSLDLGQGVSLEFGRPIDKASLQYIQLFEKVDTIYQKIPYELREDSVKIRTFYVDTKWKAGAEYQLSLDSAVVYDIYGQFNNKIEQKFKVRTEEEYGKIMLLMGGVNTHTLVQLYKADEGKTENGKRKFQIVRELEIDQDGTVVFELLPEGKYRVRAILDVNANGIWDTGLYLKKQQAEEIVYSPIDFTVKQNFEIEQKFHLQKTYKEEVEEKDKK